MDTHYTPHTLLRHITAAIIAACAAICAEAKDIVWQGTYFTDLESQKIEGSFEQDKTFYLYNVGQKKFLNVGGSYDAEPILTNVGMKMKYSFEAGGGRAYLRTPINNPNYTQGFCLGMAGNINNTSVPIRVLCDLPAVITPSTEDKYEYNTQCGWYITPVTSGSRTVYIRNSRRGDVAAYDHLYYNPSTKRVEVADGQDDDNARWMLITLDEYRRQIFDLRDGNIEVTAFIDDSRFNRNNLWENSWAWQNTAGRLHNIGESEDVVADDGTLIKEGWGLPAIQTWVDPSRGSVGVNYYSQFNVAEIKGETNRLSQTITGLPAGMYRVTCQAFYYDGADGTATDGSCYLFANAQRETLRPRCDISQDNPEGKNSSEWVRYQRNSDNGFSITYAYNNVEISGTKVYDHTFCTSDANGMPTDGMAAAKLFNYTETNCLNEVYVSIREGEDLVIGINKGTTSGWVAADNFRLYYLGNYESVLDEDALPSQALADNIFNTNISLRRTLGDKWTSIVLPFDLTQKQFDEAFSESATISELVGIDPSYEYRILFKKKQRVADDEVYMEAGKHYIMSGACAPKYDEGQEYSFIINNNSSLLTKVSGPLYQLSNINRLGPTPHAALYDLMVHPSGNAYDHSETHEMVSTHGAGTAITAQLNEQYGRVEAQLANTWGGTASAYYSSDYSDNVAQQADMATAHAVAMLVKPGQGVADGMLMGSMADGGGFGLSISGGTLQYSVCTAAGTCTANSGVTPQAGRYYYVIGAWDKATRKVSIYVDGELKGEATAGSADMQWPAAAHHTLAVGANYDGSQAVSATVVVARIYDKAMTADLARDLYKQLTPLADKPEIKHTVSNGRDRYLTFRGTFGYDEAHPAPKGAYMVAGGNMYHLTADTKLYGFRAYIQETDAEGVPLNAQQSPSRLSMRITDEGGQTTDISTVETDGTAARTVHAPAIYDLTGRAVRLGTTSTDGLPKGIYIVDGRKTVVR